MIRWTFLLLVFIAGCSLESGNTDTVTEAKEKVRKIDYDKGVQIITGTFLGNKQRNYYGENPPNKLTVLWKKNLGHGRTDFSDKEWAGAGWTGQPLITKEYGKLYIYQGAYDHNLKKLDGKTGEIIWQYQFDDIIKGTGTIYKMADTSFGDFGNYIIQGSRRGYGIPLGAKECFSLRAISMMEGKEVWRYNVRQTMCISRDVDGSALIYNDTVAMPLENGMLSFINPLSMEKENGYYFPEEIDALQLFDKKAGRNNVIVESSPCMIGNIIYVTAGSGYVYGINKNSRDIEFKFYIGSDLNGSPVVTNDTCILIPIEKQYIAGNGGILKLNPRKENPVVWFFPTGNRHFSDWEGGVIGSCAVLNELCAFTGIEGTLYLCEHSAVSDYKVKGFDGRAEYPSPVMLDKFNIGPSISSPIIIGNKLIACSYTGAFLFEITPDRKLKLLDKFISGFESTPACCDKKVFVASRDGNLYCFGEETNSQIVR